jgi:hypothetical protein
VPQRVASVRTVWKRQNVCHPSFDVEYPDLPVEVAAELCGMNDRIDQTRVPNFVSQDAFARQFETFLQSDRPDQKNERHMFV